MAKKKKGRPKAWRTYDRMADSSGPKGVTHPGSAPQGPWIEVF
ncbi:hypothetical protein [Pseudonocardia sp. EV170527-09]|nr:hypothetical protein [Pseudonocardia sp. EV170527-09]